MRKENWATLGYFLLIVGAMTSEKSGSRAGSDEYAVNAVIGKT